MKNRSILLIVLLAITASAAVAFAIRPGPKLTSTSGQEQGESYLVATDADHLAVKGYDVVAYFSDAKATAGSSDHESHWRGATWRFASAENKASFDRDPASYAPEYGGYCAWGVAAKNDLFEVDPEAWKVVGGKLYLNFNKEVQSTWLDDTAGFIRSADENWPGLVNANVAP